MNRGKAKHIQGQIDTLHTRMLSAEKSIVNLQMKTGLPVYILLHILNEIYQWRLKNLKILPILI